jgi:opacity protein-like surface antigen
MKGEIGVTVGAAYYLGDINHSKQFYSPSFAFGALYRYNIDTRYSWRISFNRIVVKGSDSDFPSLYQKTRNHSFRNEIFEIGLSGEFNFMDYAPYNFENFSPYVSLGGSLAITQIPTKKFQFVVPFGAGVKYAINKKLYLGLEWVFRKTFTDRIDLLYNSSPDPALPPQTAKQISNENSKDWYTFAGLTISFNIESEKKWCPAYQKHKQ